MYICTVPPINTLAVEFSTLVRSPQGQMQWSMLGAAEIDALVKATDLKKPDDM
jgi:hypothetical protein